MVNYVNRFYGAERLTPFSKIDLDQHPHHNLTESLSTMDIELEQAVLVIRGTHKGQEVEFQIGNLVTQGTGNGMVLIHRQEHEQFFSDHPVSARWLSQTEYRLLLDCELKPDKNGHAYTIRMRDQNS